jgi:SSS family transporter
MARVTSLRLFPWIILVLLTTTGLQAENEMVSVEIRPIANASQLPALVEPTELPEGHAAAPLPLFGDVRGTSGQAFLLAASQTGPRELTLLTYHTITSTWAVAGAVELPDAPTAIEPIERGFLVHTAGNDTPTVVEIVQKEQLMAFFDWVVIAAYLLAMLGVGWICYNQEKRSANATTDYFLAGREVPWWAAGISLYATGTSAYSFVAIPAKSFDTNWLNLAPPIIGVAGLVLVAYLIIPLIRRLDLISIYEYLEIRFHPSIRLMSSALMILFQLGSRLSVVLYLPALAISAVTGANIVTCIVLMGIVTTAYTLVGGMKAVIWTDVIQVFVMMGGALFAIGYVIYNIEGGFGELLSITQADNKAHLFDFSWDYSIPTVWAVTLAVLVEVPAWPKDQSMMQRVLATKDDKAARSSVLTLALVVIPGSVLFFAIGTALYAFYKSHPERLNPLADTDATFPIFIAAEMPIGITGLIIAGLFAASMSTLSSGLNSVATLSSVDFYERLAKNPSQQKSLKLAYLITIVGGVLSTVVAVLFSFFDIKSMFDIMLQLTAVLGGGFAGCYALGLFTKRTNWQGAWIGTIASIAAAILLKPYVAPNLLTSASIGICILVGFLSSYLFPAPTQQLAGLTVFNPLRPKSTVRE